MVDTASISSGIRRSLEELRKSPSAPITLGDVGANAPFAVGLGFVTMGIAPAAMGVQALRERSLLKESRPHVRAAIQELSEGLAVSDALAHANPCTEEETQLLKNLSDSIQEARVQIAQSSEATRRTAVDPKLKGGLRERVEYESERLKSAANILSPIGSKVYELEVTTLAKCMSANLTKGE